MAKKRISLTAQILLITLSLVLIISVALTAFFIRSVTVTSENHIQQTADATLAYLNADIEKALTPTIEMITLAASFIGKTPVSTLQGTLYDMLSTNKEAFEMYYCTNLSRFQGGILIMASGFDLYAARPDMDAVTRPWFIAAINSPDRTLITEPYVDTQTGKICVTAVKVCRNDSGAIAGVVGTDMYIDVLTDIVDSRKITGDGHTWLITGEGLFITHSDPDAVMKKNIFDEGAHFKREEILSKQRTVTFTGNSYVCSVPVGGTDWFIVSTGTLDSLRDTERRLFITALAVTVLLALFGAALMAVFVFRTLKPLTRTVNALKKISNDWDLTRRIDIKGSRELAELAEIFNLTFEKMKGLIELIKQKTQTLSGIGSDLSINMTETASAVHQITSNIQNIKGRVINQSASVTQTHATMDQISGNIQKLSHTVALQTESVSQSSAAIEEMLANIQSVTSTLIKNSGNVKSLADAAGVGRTGLKAVADDIQEIARESEGLLEINAVMENIAAQTNLLAMNAAIEAAHAGEAGRGFAVVSGEIRKLAENSSKQSRTISDVLKKIKEAIDKITAAAEGVLTKFEAIDEGVKTVAEQEENIRLSMEEQNAGSQQVLEAVGQLNELTRQVKGGSAEMQTGSSEVIRESSALAETTEEISGSMNEVASGADQINKAVMAVQTISAANKENIEILAQEVAKFKV